MANKEESGMNQGIAPFPADKTAPANTEQTTVVKRKVGRPRKERPAEADLAKAQQMKSVPLTPEQVKVRNKAEIGDKIRAFRLARKLNQPQLAAILGVTKNAITNWEAGLTRPEFDLIAKLCRALDISADAFFDLPSKANELTQREWEHVKLYRTLPEPQQLSVDTLMEALITNEQKALWEDCRRNFTSLQRSSNPAAAGLGEPLQDSYDMDTVFLRNSRNVCRADIIITVSGDSMMPTFLNGDDLLVEYTEEVEPGEIGIFIVAGEGFVKEFRKDGLHSHNPRYKTIHPHDGDNFRCVGRVLGVVTPDMMATPRELAVLNEMRSSRRKR